MNELDILIIEDDDALITALKDSLVAANYTVTTASGGQDGLKIAFERHPKILLLDLIMPGMGGMAVLRQIRNDPWGATLPVIVLTNLPSETKHAEALQLGAVGFYLKAELPLRKLQEIVKPLLEASKDQLKEG